MLETLKTIRFRYILDNLCYLLTRNLADDMQQPELRLEAVYQRILHLPSPDAETFRDEIMYLRNDGWTAFPYPQTRTLGPVCHGRDPRTGLPFVEHAGKRLFFPRAWPESRAESAYRGYIESECILGGGYRRKAPHQYQTETFRVRDGDVVVDIGSAEGLFALDVVDRAKRVYLFECDPLWHAPLSATFAPYADKVQIIPRAVGDRDSRRSVTLASGLRAEADEPLFIKMDIEGAETPVIRASLDFLRRAKYPRLCCCAYHRLDDADRLTGLLESAGFETAFSDGYMLYSKDRDQQRPYFRHGVIRAWRPDTLDQSPLTAPHNP